MYICFVDCIIARCTANVLGNISVMREVQPDPAVDIITAGWLVISRASGHMWCIRPAHTRSHLVDHTHCPRFPHSIATARADTAVHIQITRLALQLVLQLQRTRLRVSCSEFALVF